jgi:hypothetical protein
MARAGGSTAQPLVTRFIFTIDLPENRVYDNAVITISPVYKGRVTGFGTKRSHVGIFCK